MLAYESQREGQYLGITLTMITGGRYECRVWKGPLLLQPSEVESDDQNGLSGLGTFKQRPNLYYIQSYIPPGPESFPDLIATQPEGSINED